MYETETEDEEGNVGTSDQEEPVMKTVQQSNIEAKVKLNDYVFDERQNLQADLSKFSIYGALQD